MAKKKNQKSKNVKKEVSEKIEKQESNIQKELLKILKIVFAVLVFLSAFYLLTVAIVSNDNEDEVADTAIQYEEILAGSSFSMRDSEYLVVYYDFTDEELSDLASSIYSYSYLDGSIRLYTVDMSNGFNAKYVSEGESNKSPTTAADLLISGPTLIKVSDGKAVEYIEGVDSVISYLS